MKSLAAFLAMAVSAGVAQGQAPEQEPPLTPRIEMYAEFLDAPRCPVFERGAPVRLWVKIAGDTVVNDTLAWGLSDWRGSLKASGAIPVPPVKKAWTHVIDLDSSASGYFEVHLKLDKCGVSLPAAGSRPAGMVSYAVLPAIKGLPSPAGDQSRFGMQGDCFVGAPGDKTNPVYGLVGAKWKYALAKDRFYSWFQRYWRIFYQGQDPAAHPAPDLLGEEALRSLKSPEADAGMCPFVELSGIPAWMSKFPEGMSKEARDSFVDKRLAQFAYPPSDFARYAELIGAAAAEHRAFRSVRLPKQKRGYYEIHWEPDWSWKGSDEDFIKMYETASKAIKENDPDGLLLGVNYGVLASGNKSLERLFKKGLGSYLDGIVFHTYYLPQGQSPEKGGMIENMRKLASLKRQYLKPDAPLVNAEWGVHLWRSLPAYNLQALDKEAAYLTRGHLTVLGEGASATFLFFANDMREGGMGWGLFYNLTLPNLEFGPSNIAPKPAFSTAALATRILDGAKNISPLEHLGDNVWGYAFDRDGIPVAVVWSTDDKPRRVSFPAGAGAKPTQIDPMGNEKPLECVDGLVETDVCAAPSYLLGVDRGALPSGHVAELKDFKLPEGSKAVVVAGGKLLACGSALPRETPPGRRLLCAVDSGSGRWLAAKTIDVKAPVKIEKSADDFSGRMEFAVENLLDSGISGSLRIESSNGDSVASSRSVEIPPKESRTLALDVSKQPREELASAVFEDSFGVATRLDLDEKGVFGVCRTAKPPALDGDLKKWQLELFRSAAGKDSVVIGQSFWEGDQDLSFKQAAQYDDENLYIAVKVRDQFHLQTKESSELWKEDSVQLSVAVNPDKGSWKSCSSYAFAKRSDGDGALLAWRHSSNSPLPAGVKFAVRRVGDETHYEIAIPWRTLDPGLKIEPGTRVGLGVLVNDVDIKNDGQRSARKGMEAFGGTNKEKLGILLLQ